MPRCTQLRSGKTSRSIRRLAIPHERRRGSSCCPSVRNCTQTVPSGQSRSASFVSVLPLRAKNSCPVFRERTSRHPPRHRDRRDDYRSRLMPRWLDRRGRNRQTRPGNRRRDSLRALPQKHRGECGLAQRRRLGHWRTTLY